MDGHVKTIVADRGFGFISAGGVEYFFHAKDLAPGLLFGEQLIQQRVKFTGMQGPRGPKAGDVRPAD